MYTNMATRSGCANITRCVFIFVVAFACCGSRGNVVNLKRSGELGKASHNSNWKIVQEVVETLSKSEKWVMCVGQNNMKEFLSMARRGDVSGMENTVFKRLKRCHSRMKDPKIDGLLNLKIRKRRQVPQIIVPPFVSLDGGNDMIQNGFPLLTATINNNRQVFNPSDSVSDTFSDRLQDIYNYIYTNWRPVNGELCNDFEKGYADGGFCANASRSREEFFDRVIQIYDHESIYHGGINKALVRQGIEYGYNPTQQELMTGTYALALDVVLMYWSDLEKYTDTTYYGVNVDDTDRSQYTVGTSFTWLKFISATKIETLDSLNLKNTLFVIDNSQKSSWQPRDISTIRSTVQAMDVIYPIGAQFKVTDREGGAQHTKIYIKLISASVGLHQRQIFLTLIMTVFCFTLTKF